MPETFDESDISSVVQIYATTIASPSVDRLTKNVCLRAFLLQTQAERRVFHIFVNAPELLERLNLHVIVNDKSDKDLSALACKAISFLMRYNVDLDYFTFSKDANFVRAVRRFVDINT